MDLYRRKGSRYWWARGRDVEGRVWRESTHQTDKAAAKIAGRVIERRILLAAGETENTATLGDGLAAVEAADVRADRAPGTREYHRTKGGHLSRLLGAGTRLSTLDAAALQKYADQRIEEGADRHTVHKDFIVLRFAARLAGAPIPRTALPDLGRVYVPRDRWLTEAEYRKLLIALPASYRDRVVAYFQTGVRHSELYRIHARHVHAGFLHVEGTKTEASARVIPLSPDGRHLFERLAKEKPDGPLFPLVDKTIFRRAMVEACAHAKIAFVTPNDMRRTFCSWLANKGTGEGEAAAILGNSSRMVRRVYQQFSAERMRAAVAKLPRVTSRAQSRAQRDER